MHDTYANSTTDGDFQRYIKTRNVAVDVVDDAGNSNPQAGDPSLEGLVLVPSVPSPENMLLWIVGNKVSGTTFIYAVETL